MFGKILRSSSELAATQAQQSNINRGLATEVQGSLQTLRDVEVQEVLGAFAKIHSQLVMS